MIHFTAIMLSLFFAVSRGDYDPDMFVLHFSMVYGVWSMTTVLTCWNRKDEFLRMAMVFGTVFMVLTSIFIGWRQSHIDYYNAYCIGCVVASSIGMASDILDVLKRAYKTTV